MFHVPWLAGSLQSQFIVFENGSNRKFKREFKQMCVQDNYGIKVKPTTSHNIPYAHANAIIERVNKGVSYQ
jgi:hypothetical protein